MDYLKALAHRLAGDFGVVLRKDSVPYFRLCGSGRVDMAYVHEGGLELLSFTRGYRPRPVVILSRLKQNLAFSLDIKSELVPQFLERPVEPVNSVHELLEESVRAQLHHPSHGDNVVAHVPLLRENLDDITSGLIESYLPKM